MRLRAFWLASAAFMTFPAYAQIPTGVPATSQDRAEDHVHREVEEEIVITAPFVRDLNLLAGTASLSGSDLVRDMRPQLGETLARLPGVSATSFGPGASRPVLRGFQGERVKILVDGIGSIDVSNSSADHAVTIDPITSDRIEVLHGPAVLLFGSQAIGGAVNVFDRRIPRSIPDDPVHVDGLAGFGSAASEFSFATGVDIPVGRSGFVLHFDGSLRDSDDLRVGGHILSPILRAEELARAEQEMMEGHEGEAEEALGYAALKGRLPNSFTTTWTAGAGAALIRDGGNIGISFSLHDSRYGVPTRPGAGHHHDGDDDDHDHDHDHDHGDEDHDDQDASNVSIDLRQYRGDLRGEIDLGGLFKSLRLRLAAADYEHIEFEGLEVGTVFRTRGAEGRIEAVQADRSGWRGVVGGQFVVRDFEAVGAEAFVPPHDVRQFGLFALQEVDLGAFEIEGAARIEHSKLVAQSLGQDRQFNAFSLAAGASWEVSPLVRIGVNVSRSERAPSPEELFSDGPHIATQAYEIGDPGLSKESSLGAELYFRAQIPGLQASATFFTNRFADYVYQSATGEEELGLPVFRYFQADADHWGVEVGATVGLVRIGSWQLDFEGVADFVRATIRDGGGPVPRIPPLRLLAALEGKSPNVDARAEFERVFHQDRVADFETPTEGFTLVNASATWRPWGRSNPTSLILAVNNLFDVEARRHASFTKDYVPLSGRDLRLSARISF